MMGFIATCVLFIAAPVAVVRSGKVVVKCINKLFDEFDDQIDKNLFKKEEKTDE